MANKVKVMKPIGAKPTKEELEAQAKRAFLQKRNSLAELILANALHTAQGTTDYKPFVDGAIDAADYMMAKLYSVAIKDGE